MSEAASGGVLITGASTGIGEACALHLDSLGFRVFAGVRRAADGERLRGGASERLTPVTVEITDPVSIGAAAQAVAEATGDAGLAGLVNNAGVAVSGPVEFIPVDELRRQLEVNVVGQVAVTQAFLPLIRRGSGRIVNMSSIGGRVALPLLGPYAASKFALEALSDSLRRELRPWGIEVSLIEPGGITTPIWAKSGAAADELLGRMPPQVEELYGKLIERIRKEATRFGETGLPPLAVAKAVAHALTARRPKTRYLIGREAKLRARVSWLVSDRTFDALVARTLGWARGRS